MNKNTSTKQLLVGLTVSLLCCACSSTPVYRSDNYAAGTHVLSDFQEGKETYTRRNPQVGEYDEYFDQVSKSAISYQLVYHHPGDFVADTNDYYLAFVHTPVKKDSTTPRATYNGKELPIAVNQRKAVPLENSFLINIRLTREQLIEAYEGPGKLIILLSVGPTTYEVVFPDYYLRKVLAKTTNLTKYKVDEQITSAVNRQDNASQPTRTLFTYNKTFTQDSGHATLYPNQGRAENLSFGVKTDKPSLSFTVNAVRQQVLSNAIGSRPAEQSSYIKSVSMQEIPGHENACARIKVSFDDSHTLKIQCKDVFGLNDGTWFVHLYDKPTCTAGCSVTNRF